MKRKTKHKGQKLKNISDPLLAKPHQAGAVVEFVQISIDKKWGRYVFIHFRRFGGFLNESLKEYKKSLKLLEAIRKIKVDSKTNDRFIDFTLTNKLEVSSTKFLILTKLGIEYLVEEYSLSLKQIKKHRGELYEPPISGENLLNKLKSMSNALNIQKPIPIELTRVLERRDIVEHPKNENLYDCSEQGWKNVNLSWVLSGEFDGIADPIVEFVNEFIQSIEKYIKDNPIPGSLTGIKRGIKAGESFKN